MKLTRLIFALFLVALTLAAQATWHEASVGEAMLGETAGATQAATAESVCDAYWSDGASAGSLEAHAKIEELGQTVLLKLRKQRGLIHWLANFTIAVILPAEIGFPTK